MPATRSAVFADRDGTVIEDPGYLSDPAGVKLLPGAADALRALRDLGFRLVVVSNQSGIGRRLISDDEARAVHDRFMAELERHGVRLDDVRYCPHAPHEGCACRKPLPGLLVEAAEKLGVELSRSFMVGDKPSDVEAGRRAGCTTVLLGGNGSHDATPDYLARDWAEVSRVIRAAAGHGP
jgi:D-glycero-D-manno-heptose 1,7-bisphosphate phosphatase